MMTLRYFFAITCRRAMDERRLKEWGGEINEEEAVLALFFEERKTGREASYGNSPSGPI